MIELDGAIARYFVTAKGGEAAAFLAAFAPDAVVADEGRTHRGHAEIAAWRRETSRKYNVVTTPEAIETRGNEQVVTALVEGDFPKAGLPDPLRLEYRFRLADGLISSLSIGLPRN